MNSIFPKTLVLKSVAFFIIWLVISGKFNLFHMGVGLASSVGLAWLHTSRRESRSRLLPFVRMCWYFPWLLGRSFRSGLHLAFLILHPALPIDPKLIPYCTKLRDSGAIVLLGNSVTLTPGTVTVEVNSQELKVHAMDDESAHDLTSLQLENKINGIFEETRGS